jgi:hypothetical protein
MLTFVCFKQVGLVYSKVGTGAASKFYSEQHLNDAALQHCT